MKLIATEFIQVYKLCWTYFIHVHVYCVNQKVDMYLNVELKYHTLADFNWTKVTGIFQYAIGL